MPVFIAEWVPRFCKRIYNFFKPLFQSEACVPAPAITSSNVTTHKPISNKHTLKPIPFQEQVSVFEGEFAFELAGKLTRDISIAFVGSIMSRDGVCSRCITHIFPLSA